MRALSYQISTTLLLQFVSTAIIIGLYAVTTSLREQKAHHISTCYMVLLVSFLFEYHPTIKDLTALTGVPKEMIEKKTTTLKYFASHISQFMKDGKLPSFELSPSTTILEHLLYGLIAPLMSVAFVFVLLDENRERGALFVHTEYRKNAFSKIIMLLVCNLLLAAVIVRFLLPFYRKLSTVIIVISLLGIVASIIFISMIIVQQQYWKEYWSNRLLEVMGVSEHEKNHDLFNRAMILNNYVDCQPDFPIPGRLGLYTAIYSAVQTSIIFVARYFHLS